MCIHGKTELSNSLKLVCLNDYTVHISLVWCLALSAAETAKKFEQEILLSAVKRSVFKYTN